MPDRSPAGPDPELLPESVVAPLLARASELDAAHDLGLKVAALRAAAAEAGISERAFDAALAEMRGADGAHPVAGVGALPRRRSRALLLAGVAAVLIALGALGVSRAVPSGPPPPIGQQVVEEALLLQCLSPRAAAELIRPLLRDRSSSIVISPDQAPRVITIRTTPTGMRDVKALLERHESGGGASCPSGRA